MQVTKKNLTPVRIPKHWKKRPITNEQIDRLKRIPLNIDTFQRTARNHYKTTKVGSLLYLNCLVTGKKCVINFNSDLFSYHIVTGSAHPKLTFTFKKDTNRSLFIRLRRNHLI